MKFTYYSKKKTNTGVCFFTIRTDNDDEMFRINALTRKYRMETLLDFDCEVGVFDESVTNIQTARKLYNQIKQEAESLKEDELVQRYYFTDDDYDEVWECFATPEEAYNKAEELANEYNSTIYVNTVIGEEIVDTASPDAEPVPEQLSVELQVVTRLGCFIYAFFEVPADYTDSDLSEAVRNRGFIEYRDFMRNGEWIKVADKPEKMDSGCCSDCMCCFDCHEIATGTEQNESTALEPEQNEIPHKVKEVLEDVIRPAVNTFYKTAEELTVLFLAFGKACMTIQYVRPPPENMG